MSSTTEWADLRRLARRRALRRALSVLAFLPVGIVFLGAAAYSAWNPETLGASVGVFVWPLRAVGSLLPFFLIVWFGFETLGDFVGAFGDPSVVRGKVVEKTETTNENLAAVILRSLFGYELVVDIQRAIAIGPGGSTSEDRERLGSKQDVPATRRVHHGVAVEQEIVLVCTSTGRAIATLSDLREAATAEIMGFLQTEFAAQAELSG